MPFRFVSVAILLLALGCTQTGNLRDAPAAEPSAKEYKRGAMQPVPSAY